MSDLDARPTSGRNLANEDLTAAVIASFDGARSGRFREVAQSLVRNLHAFVSEVRPTEDEWFRAIDFLTRTGHITDDKRQEFVLLSDVLGVSMLVVGINNPGPGEATEPTVFGPFFVEESPRYANGGDIGNGAPGEPCFFAGRVLSQAGGPVAAARVEVWQADDRGYYDVQYAGLTEARGRGHLYSDDEGRFWFWTVKPEAYPIPDDGPVGELLAAGGRSPMRPAHIHFLVAATGHRTLITHVFADRDEHLDSDAVFGVRTSLVTEFRRNEPGTAPDGRRMDRPYYTASYDLVLTPADVRPGDAARSGVDDGRAQS